MHPLAAAGIAVVGSVITALCTAVQQRAARRAPKAGGVALLRALLRTPAWVVASLGLPFGYGCYLVALAVAPLTLIQPILLGGLVLGTLFAAWLAGGRPDPKLVAGCVLSGAGLVALLTLARPEAGDYLGRSDTSWIGVGGVLGLTLLAALLLGRSRPAPALALAAGGLYGVTAVCTKLVLAQMGAHGWAAPLTHWSLYAVLVTAPLGFVLSQRSFQLSPLLAPVNAVMSVVDPVVATAIGIVVYGERVQVSPLVSTGQVLALVAVAAGVSWVNRRGTAMAEARPQDPLGETAARWG